MGERISVADGKYTFIERPHDWRVEVLRHGDPWLVIEDGSKAVLALMHECGGAYKVGVDDGAGAK